MATQPKLNVMLQGPAELPNFLLKSVMLVQNTTILSHLEANECIFFNADVFYKQVYLVSASCNETIFKIN